MTGKNNLLFGVFLVVCAFILLVNLGGWDLSGPDEPRYAQIAREMLKTGRFLVPHLNAKAYPDKPPLLFWLIALGSQPFGDVSAFSARLPSALAALGTILLLYLFARKLYDPVAALLAPLILFTSRKFFDTCLSVHFDPLLTFWITLSLFLFYCGYERQGGSRKYFLFSYVSMGCALLTKGPVGFAVPLGTIALFLVLKKDFGQIKKLMPGRGLLIMLGMMALWLVPACIFGGEDYAQNILFKQTFGRVAKSFAHNEPFYFYFSRFPMDFLPWTLFIPGAVVAVWKIRTKSNNLLFPAAWFGVTFTLFSLVSCKRGLYLLPLYPAAALIMAKSLSTLIPMESSGMAAPQKRLMRIPCYLLFGGGAAAGVFCMVAFSAKLGIIQDLASGQSALFPAAALAAIGGFGAILYIIKRPGMQPVLRALSFFLIAAALAAVLCIFPAVKNLRSSAPFCAKIQLQVEPHDKLFALFTPYVFNYWMRRCPIPVVRDSAALETLVHSSEKIFFLARKRDYDCTSETFRSAVAILEKGRIGHKSIYLLVNKTAGNVRQNPEAAL